MRIADLLEAEGRSLRDAARTEGRTLKKHTADLTLAAALLLVAAPLAIAGLCLVLASLFLILRGSLGPPVAAALTGVVTLGVVGILIWMFKSLTR